MYLATHAMPFNKLKFMPGYAQKELLKNRKQHHLGCNHKKMTKLLQPEAVYLVWVPACRQASLLYM